MLINRIASITFVIVFLQTSPVLGNPKLVQPLVCLKNGKGCMIGTLMKDLDNNHFEAYMGIPYAKPPLGKLRFANPVKHEGWHGIYNATQSPSACIQREIFSPTPTVFGSEDCLYLNVYKPVVCNDYLPVMVYIHGGGFVSGSVSPDLYGPEKFMSNQSIILVTIQYRLGALGFLSTGDCVAPGNFGLKDQTLALRWVKENIKQFGGNAKLVTLFGQSAGAVSAQLHMLSPLSKGLFHRSIHMSGTALIYFREQNPLNVAKVQVAAAGIISIVEMTPKQIIEALRGVDAATIAGSFGQVQEIFRQQQVYYIFVPVIEKCINTKTFLSEDPQVLWEQGKYHSIPWMTGYVQNEGTVISLRVLTNEPYLNFVNANAPHLIPTFVELNESSSSALKDRFFGGDSTPDWITSENGQRFTDMISEGSMRFPALCGVGQHLSNNKQAPVSVYYFNFEGRYSYCYFYSSYSQQKYGVCHSDDLLYIFRQPAVFPDFALGAPESVMSRKMVNFLVEYAYTGKSLARCENKENCKFLEFSNCNGCRNPVKITKTQAHNPDMSNFWMGLYNVSCNK